MMSVYRGCEMPLSCVTVTVVAAGPTNAGKTSLITRFKSDTFNEVSALLDFNKMICYCLLFHTVSIGFDNHCLTFC